MEIIKNIKEVNDVDFGERWSEYDGYCIETDKRQLYFVISNEQCCCENWGYLSSEDDFGSFIGSELKNVYVTDTKLETIVPKMEEDLDAGSAMFIMLKRLEACYNLLHIMNTTDITVMMYYWYQNTMTRLLLMLTKRCSYETYSAIFGR